MTVSSGNNNKKKEASFKYNGNNYKGYGYGGIHGYKDYYNKYRNYYSYYKIQNYKNNNNQYETIPEEKQKKRAREKSGMKQKEKPKTIEESEQKVEEEKIKNVKKKNVIKILKRPSQTKTEEVSKKGNIDYCKDSKEKERKRDKGNNNAMNEMTKHKKAKLDSRERGRKLIENLKFNSSQQLLFLLLGNTKKYHLEKKRLELVEKTQKTEEASSKNIDESKEHELDNKNKKENSKLHNNNSSVIDSKRNEKKGEKLTQENNAKNILGILNKNKNVLYMKKKNEEVQPKEEIDIGRKMGEEILNLINKGYRESSVQDLKKQEKTENRVCFNLERSNQGEDAYKDNELKQIKDKSKSSNNNNSNNNNNNNSSIGFTIGNTENSTTTNSTIMKPTKVVLPVIPSEKMEVNNGANDKIVKSNTTTASKGDSVHSRTSLINKSLELEGTKSKSLQINHIMEEKKERNSFFAMPLYMRSPEPEEIPIPIYLSDNEKNKETKIKMPNDKELKEQTDGSNDKATRNKSMLFDEMKIKHTESKNDKKSETEESVELMSNSNEEEKTEVTIINQEKDKEKINHSNRSSIISNGSNNSTNNENTNAGNDMNKTSSNAKFMEESYLNKNHFTSSKKKYVDNGPKKITSNKNYNLASAESNKKTSNEYMSHKGFKKNYRTFHYTSQYFGGAHNLNGIYPKSKRSFKVDKCYNSRKYKTKANLDDNSKNKHFSFLNDMKIAVY